MDVQEERILVSEVTNVDSLCAVFGLVFPESATEFQKAVLLLAHLGAALRNCVLQGIEIPQDLINAVDQLVLIIESNRYKQK